MCIDPIWPPMLGDPPPIRHFRIAHSTAANSSSTTAYLDSVSEHQRELASTSFQESPCRCKSAYPIPCLREASTWIVVSRMGSKCTNTGGEIRARLRVLRSGRRGLLAAATSVENPANCSTNPMKERSSDTLVGLGKCDSALSDSCRPRCLQYCTYSRDVGWKCPVKSQQVVNHSHGVRQCCKRDIRSPIVLVPGTT
ncbi:hypothetical protein OUZ56_017975 [Daphnia magna]|uniref:Uncharacterized protein n=1 Tax=Daphnia magna TaxID=35525 RepID=A0ABR0ATT7_9CRUS|nr:hypothetical protein OUZ56_017975 [Daphnia magna]